MEHAVDANPATVLFDVPPATVTHTRPPFWRRWLRPLAYEAMKNRSHELIERVFEKAPEIFEKAPEFIEKAREFIEKMLFRATVKRKLD